MTTPPDKTLSDLSGEWRLNKSLSIDVASVLALQGTSTLVRKAIGSASVTLKISQPKENQYSIKQTATAAAVPGTTEQYILDNDWRTNKDAFFGEVEGRSRWVSFKEAEKLCDSRSTWDDRDNGTLIFAEGGKKDESWRAWRIWGFEELEGQIRYTQTVKVWTKDGEELQGKMVYDFAKY